jgi:hypothetical protein
MSILDRLLADLDGLPTEQLPAAIGALEAAKARAWARLSVAPPTASESEPDHLLGIEEASERLGVTRDWLRRRPTLPFVVKLSSGVVRYSARGIAAFIEANRQSGT